MNTSNHQGKIDRLARWIVFCFAIVLLLACDLCTAMYAIFALGRFAGGSEEPMDYGFVASVLPGFVIAQASGFGLLLNSGPLGNPRALATSVMILQGIFFSLCAYLNSNGGFFPVLAFTSFLAAFVLFQEENRSEWFRASRLWWLPLPGVIFLLASATSSKVASLAPTPITPEAAKDFAERKLAAEKGDAEAQLRLAESYATGYGVAWNHAEAFRWTFNAALQGNAEAQLTLGNYYRDGYGTGIDPVAAVKWYRLAANQGSEFAQSELGNCYREGVGVEKNLPEALRWYRMAAKGGDSFAREMADELQKEIEAKTREQKPAK